MSQIMTLNGEIQFVLNQDDNITTEDLSDIIYADGTRAILVNSTGQIIDPGFDMHTVVLQEEDLDQYYINEEDGQILIADEQDTSITSLEGAEIVQYVDEASFTMEEPQIIYVNTVDDSELSQYQITDLEEESLAEGVTLEANQVVHLNQLIGDATIVDTSSEASGYQYAILKDGKLHIQTCSGEVFPLATTSGVVQAQESGCLKPTEAQEIDLSRITGKNLLTGQTVTLHNYMDKLQKKIKDTDLSRQASNDLESLRKRRKHPPSGLKGLLHKKLTLGKTSSGKRLVGKVIHVEASEGSTRAETVVKNNKQKLLPTDRLVSKECLEYVCRTLSGLMSMDSVKKKLLNKHVIVKVVEKMYNEDGNGYTRKVSFCSGYLQGVVVANEEGDMAETWSFISTSHSEHKTTQFEETINLRVMITQDKNCHRSIRVVLNPSSPVQCSACGRHFRSAAQLKIHTSNAHTEKKDKVNTCEVCALQFENSDSLLEHQERHVEEGKLFQCKVAECGKLFLTTRGLQRHGAVHDTASKLRQCSVCAYKCSTTLAFNKHLLSHMTEKQYTCNKCGRRCVDAAALSSHKRVHELYNYSTCSVCKRQFSRYSNLQRHMAIHKGAEQLYQCSICDCSYHYMSSLTRHVVQNHIQRSDENKEEVYLKNDTEES